MAIIVKNIATKGSKYINPLGYLFLDKKTRLGQKKSKKNDKFEETNEYIQFATN